MTRDGLLKHLEKNFSKEIVAAFSKVKREDFVEEKYKQYAYEDRPLPIGDNATISQPTTIAFMLDLLDLKNNQKILEIGSGCGYVLELMSYLSLNSIIYGIEINEDVFFQSKKIIKKNNIHLINDSGINGLKAAAPFDRILVSAAFFDEPIHLLDQLTDDGILVVPVGNYIYKYNQKKKETYYGFAFVNVQGEQDA